MLKKIYLVVLLFTLLFPFLYADPPCGADCDFSGNGIVNLEDYTFLSQMWGECLPWAPDGLPPQILAHWRFDNNALDSRSNYDGTINGTPEWLPAPQAAVGSAAILMHGQEYIEIESDNFLDFPGSFAIEAYIKTTDTGTTQTVISKGDSAWQTGIDGQTGCFFFSGHGLTGTHYLLSQTVLTDNQWHRIAAVYDQSQYKIILYIDNQMDAEGYASGTVNPNNNNLRIGGNPEDPEQQNGWQGALDDIRIYNYAPLQSEIYQRMVYHVDQAIGNNNNSGQGRQFAFKTIQKAIDIADDGDLIYVWPGIYTEALIFWEYKGLTIKSAADAAVIRAPNDYAVSIISGSPGVHLENFVITDSEIGIYIEGTDPTLRFLTVVNNTYGSEAYIAANPVFDHCIFWDNGTDDLYNDTYPINVTYSCIETGISGTGNIYADPSFADPEQGDFHLKSEYGRYFAPDPNNQDTGPDTWVMDDQTSPCVDAGNASLNPMDEVMPNGGRLNIGAYGNTKYASKTPWPYPADLNFNGNVWIEDFLEFVNYWLYIDE